MFIRITLLYLVVLITTIYSQEIKNYNLDSVVVTASRTPIQFIKTGRNIDIINLDKINSLPVTSIDDVLDYNSGLDLRKRGPEGVQSDILIRGSSFEHSLIMIDGIKLSDPQTGHHNMNLPISFSQIERIEILKGQGSNAFGANAFSGVINIIPKRNNFNSLGVELLGGENNYYKVGLNSSLKLGNTNHNFAINQIKSDGYRPNTEFTNLDLSLNSSVNFSKTVIKTVAGYTDKDFGANSYYTARFPNQAEKTKTILLGLTGDIDFSDFWFSPKVYWRNNEDEFVLDKSNPSFYKNNHETNVFGAELQASTNILGASTTLGIEYTQNEIVSNNLGEHNRQTKGIFIEQRFPLTENLNISAGGFAYHYSEYDWQFWPGFDIAYNVFNDLKLYGNFGRAFRVPTYTELFYSDPVTKGNSALKPEETTNYELGIFYENDLLSLNSSIFKKDGSNLIDYVLNNESGLWNAQNFNKINTTGFEINMEFQTSRFTKNIIQNISVGYTYLNSDKTDLPENSRYVLDHLKHDVSLELINTLPFEIVQSWAINFEDRLTLGEKFTVDSKLSRAFTQFNIFIKASNIFNKKYEEIPGVLLPGRWIIGGIKLSIL